MHELLADYPVTIDLPVTWGQMDAFNHVNNTIYFRYFEDVRIEMMNRVGVLQYKEEHGIGPILAETRCRFKAPLSHPDTVGVGTTIRQMQGDYFMTHYRVVSHNLGRVAAEGDGLIVFYDYHRKRRSDIPQELREKILKLVPAAEKTDI